MFFFACFLPGRWQKVYQCIELWFRLFFRVKSLDQFVVNLLGELRRGFHCWDDSLAWALILL